MKWLTSLFCCAVALAQTKSLSTPSTPVQLPVSLCFLKGSSLYVQRANSSTPEKWLDSRSIANPQISPGGDAVAFTLDSTSKDPKTHVIRHIAILDGKGMKYRVLDGIPGSDSYGPTWSPDGKWIAFQHYTGKEWEVAIVGRDGSGYRSVIVPKREYEVVEHTCWSNDSSAIYCFDFEALYLVGINGKEISRTPFKDTNLEVLSGDCTFSMSPDGKQMIFGGRVDVSDIDNDGYPAAVLFLYDPASKHARRISPKGVQLSDPQWLPDGKSVACFLWSEKQTAACILDLQTGQLRLIGAGWKNPSIAAR